MVIDSSVALKWRLSDEEAVAEAGRLLTDFVGGRFNLVVPTLFDYEVANALKVAVLRGRIANQPAREFLAFLNAVDIARRDTRDLQTLALDLAFKYQRSFYDASYLALAQAGGFDFYTGDKRLFNAVAHTFTWVKWIGDYQATAPPLIS